MLIERPKKRITGQSLTAGIYVGGVTQTVTRRLQARTISAALASGLGIEVVDSPDAPRNHADSQRTGIDVA
jgi:hypothetical protein